MDYILWMIINKESFLTTAKLMLFRVYSIKNPRDHRAYFHIVINWYIALQLNNINNVVRKT